MVTMHQLPEASNYNAITTTKHLARPGGQGMAAQLSKHRDAFG